MDHPPLSQPVDPPPEPTTAGDAIASEILPESSSSGVMKKKKPKKKKKNKACVKDPFDPHSSGASHSSSSCSATSFPHSTQRGVRVSTGRRNPRVIIGSGRQKSDSVEALALPLGMSIAAVLAQKAGFAAATAILGKPKELPKERDAVSPLAFGEERAEKKTSFAQVFLLPASLLFQKLLEVVLRVRGGVYDAAKLHWFIVECLVWDKDTSIVASEKQGVLPSGSSSSYWACLVLVTSPVWFASYCIGAGFYPVRAPKGSGCGFPLS